MFLAVSLNLCNYQSDMMLSFFNPHKGLSERVEYLLGDLVKVNE